MGLFQGDRGIRQSQGTEIEKYGEPELLDRPVGVGCPILVALVERFCDNVYAIRWRPKSVSSPDTKWDEH
jgi:hypothetical protein